MHEQVDSLKPAGQTRVVLTGPDATLITVVRQERAMPGPGRNEPCPCGSNRKVKHCCGVKRGPSEEQLARAHVALLGRDAAVELQGLSDRALQHLWDNLIDVPAIDLSLVVTLPKLIGPDLKRLQESISRDDPEWGWDALTAVAEQIDTPQQRAELADALLRLRDQNRLNRRQAAAAIVDLAGHSTRFIAASLLDAVAISVGAESTPGGLHLAA
jgi:SEC-C motif